MTKKIIPSFFTFLNLISGCIAIYFVFSSQFLIVFIFLLLGIFFDFLDGFLARILDLETDFGVQISITPDLQLGAEEIPEMEITIKEHNGEEKRTSVPISAADMRNEKPARKKGRSKKETDHNDIVLSEAEMLDKKNVEHKVNKLGESDLNSKTETVWDKSEKKEKSIGKNLDKKLQDNQHETNKVEKKIISDIEVNKEDTLAENKNGSNSVSDRVMYMSVHEPLAKNDSEENKSSDNEDSFRANTKLDESMFSSVHLNDEKNSTNNNDKDAAETISKKNMYSSFHIEDKNLIDAKESKSKNNDEKKSKREKTKVSLSKNPSKKNQSKLIKNKSEDKESKVTDELKKEKDLKSQSESRTHSDKNSKNLKKENALTKNVSHKPKKKTSRKKEKINTSKNDA